MSTLPGIAWRPEVSARILHLPTEVMRAIGIAGLLLLCAYLAWASRRPRTIGVAGWSVLLPSGRSTLIQIGIGLADLGCSGPASWKLAARPRRQVIWARIRQSRWSGHWPAHP